MSPNDFPSKIRRFCGYLLDFGGEERERRAPRLLNQEARGGRRNGLGPARPRGIRRDLSASPVGAKVTKVSADAVGAEVFNLSTIDLGAEVRVQIW